MSEGMNGCDLVTMAGDHGLPVPDASGLSCTYRESLYFRNTFSLIQFIS